jgi:hypothetical protein
MDLGRSAVLFTIEQTYALRVRHVVFTQPGSKASFEGLAVIESEADGQRSDHRDLRGDGLCGRKSPTNDNRGTTCSGAMPTPPASCSGDALPGQNDREDRHQPRTVGEDSTPCRR